MPYGSLLLLGLSGPELTPDEAALFRRLQPAGYVLFARNIVSPAQTRKLTDDLCGLSIDLPILAIDIRGQVHCFGDTPIRGSLESALANPVDTPPNSAYLPPPE